SFTTYGVRCTTFGGVTGTAMVLFFDWRVSFAAALGDGAVPPAGVAPPPQAETSNAVTMPSASTRRDRMWLPLLLLLTSQPRRDAALDPLHEAHQKDAHRGHHDDRHEHAVDAEDVLVRDDQISEADEADEELRDDHPDQSSSDRKAHAGEDERRRGGQDHVGPQPPLAGREGARDLEQRLIHVAHALLRVDEDREDREQRDGRDPWLVAHRRATEGDRDERDERDGRSRVERADGRSGA